jgi:hypothetical protein
MKADGMCKIKNSKITDHNISDDEIRNRLCLNNPLLVSQILLHTIKYFDESISGRKDIDEKANWFLATATGCLTLFFTGVAVLLGQLKRPIFMSSVFFLSSFLSVTFLLISVLLFFLAIRARSDFKMLSPLDILEKDTVSEADQNAKGLIIYDRYMAAHFLDISKKNFAINWKKGKLLKIGQWFFLSGLIFLSTVSIILSYTLIDP